MTKMLPEHLVLQTISAIDHEIASIETALPYADHGAYSQDKKRLAQLREERYQLAQQLKEYPQ